MSSSAERMALDSDDINNGSGGIEAPPITFTAAALDAVHEAIESQGQQGDGLRVAVVGGGCAGYQYSLDFERSQRVGDSVFDLNGIRFYVDSVSAGYLKGTVVDFVSSLSGNGFKFSNPNARRTCGCGSSFG